MTDPSWGIPPWGWPGAYYELAVELGDRDDARLDAAIQALWRVAAIEGCFNEGRSVGPPAYDDPAPGLPSLIKFSRLYGIVALPDGHHLPCGCGAVREEDGPDWLYFYLPLDGLVDTDPVVAAAWQPAPVPSWDREFLERIDAWLVDIGVRLFKEVPFLLGLIGEEVSGYDYAEELRGVAPATRSCGYLIPESGRLSYYPATGNHSLS